MPFTYDVTFECMNELLAILLPNTQIEATAFKT